MKLSRHTNLLNLFTLTLLLSLLSAPFSKTIAQALGNLKLTEHELNIKKELDNFIVKWYQCVIDVSQFNGTYNVVDAEWVLTDSEEADIEAAIQTIKDSGHVKILFVTKEGMTWSGTMENFGTGLGNCLWIGMRKVDNGIVIQLDVRDHHSFIATGYRSETVLTDMECGRICGLWVPYFKKKDTIWGINAILEWLKAAITTPEARELSDAEKEEIQRRDQERKDMLLSIFYAILLLWLWSTGLYLLYRQRKKFDKKIENHNKKIELLLSKISWTSEWRSQLHSAITKYEKVDTTLPSWAQSELSDAIMSAKTTLGNVWEQVDDFWKPIESTWTWFLFYNPLTEWEEEALDNELSKSEWNYNMYAWALMMLDSIYDQFNQVSKEIKQWQEIRSSIERHKRNKDVLLSQWFQLLSHAKTLDSNYTSVSTTLEKLISENGTLKEKFQLLQLLKEQLWTLWSTSSNISELRRNYDFNRENLGNNTIDSKQLTNFERVYNDISSYVPDNVITRFTDMISNHPKILQQQWDIISKYKWKYQEKDLEWSYELFSSLSNLFWVIISNLWEIEAYFKDAEEKKSNVPKLYLECESAKETAVTGLHSYYADDLRKAEAKLTTLWLSVNQEKCDWIKLHQELSTLKNTFASISSNSAKKFKEVDNDDNVLASGDASSYVDFSGDDNRWWWSFGWWWWGASR